MIPAVIAADTRSPGERDLFEYLRDDKGTADWTVLHSFNLPTHVTQVEGECDFVVIVPGLGVLCLEVKAHRSVARSENGLWHLGHDTPTWRGPFQQAEDNMRSLMSILSSRRRDLADAALVWSAVAFTHTDFRVPTVEWRDWEVIDARDLRDHAVSELVVAVLTRARQEVPHKAMDGVPTPDDCQAIVKVLRPSFEVIQTPAQRRAGAAATLQAFTEEQYEAIDGMARNRRVVFEGPAGTGKTVLALEAARRAASGGEKVALICFNRLLGEWMKTQTDQIPGVTVGTIHGLMRGIAGVELPGPVPPGYFESVLPDLAAGALLESDGVPLFDALIVDEAQDILRKQYLDFLDLAVEGGLEGGRWTLFGDFRRQALFDSADIDLDDFLSRWPGVATFNLRINCRNTQRIARWVTVMSSLDPGYSSVRRPDPGAVPRMHYFSEPSLQAKVLEKEVLPALYRDGFEGQDIVLVSPYRDCAATSLSSPWKDRLRTCETATAAGHLRYATISAFKGLEAPVIILTDITAVTEDRARSLFYTGATRATEQLHVFASANLREQFLQLLDRPSGASVA
jgi:hypothetical protein